MAENSLIEEILKTPDGMPIPERIISALKQSMIYVDTLYGRRLYCIRDWVYHVSGTKTNDRTVAWANLKRAIKKDLSKDIKEGKADVNLTVEGLLNLQSLEIETAGGKQRVDFTDEEGIYQITQRMSDRSKNVREVKTYLAKSGVFMGAAYNNPSTAAVELDRAAYKRNYNRLIAEGFTPAEAQQWLDVRSEQKRQRRIITAIWSTRGINRPNDFADLTNQVHRIALGRTATRHKRELAVKDTPRNYVSAADNATIQITELAQL